MRKQIICTETANLKLKLACESLWQKLFMPHNQGDRYNFYLIFTANLNPKLLRI